MLSKKVEELMNAQIEKEGYSSLLYLSMAAWAEGTGYPGIAKWLYAQSEEEKDHMLEFIHFVNDRGGNVDIPGLKRPPAEFGTIKQMFDDVLGHEQFITASINDIVAMCIEQKDYTSQNWLQSFVAEQIEEESSVQEIIDKLNLVGEHNMYMFDRDILGMRGAGDSGDA